MKKYIYFLFIGAALLFLIPLAIVPAITSTVVGVVGSNEESSYEVSDVTYTQLVLSASVERYRQQVLEEARRRNMEEYIELFLAVMQQESGGNGQDVFQASESLGFLPNTLTLERSIKQGVGYLTYMLNKAGVSSPTDIAKIKLALQGYNFGGGYIDYALKKDGCWTQKNTLAFAKKYSGGVRNTGIRAEQLGPWRYGDQYYTEHVLRYYSLLPSGGLGADNNPAKIPLDKRMDWLFPNGIPISATQMQPYLQQIEVPIFTKKNKKSTMTVTVHKKLANQIKDIFKEMQDIKFPIDPSCTAGYCFRNMASNSSLLSYHSYGCVLDLNWTHNGATYTSWPYKPGKDRLAVTKKVVNIWKKYGWYWGGDWSQAYCDPMHFTYVNH